MTVPSFIFSFGVLLAWMLAHHYANAIRLILIAGLACSLVLCPWLTRNYVVFKSFVFVPTNSGLNLLLGNSENAGSNDGTNADISKYVAAAQGLNEIERDNFYGRNATTFIREHPAKTLRLYGLKFLNYFNYRNKLFSKSESTAARDALSLLSYGSLLAIVVLRLLSVRKHPLAPFEKFALLLYILNGAFSAIFFTRIRFRVPFDFLLIAICATTLSRLAERRLRRD